MSDTQEKPAPMLAERDVSRGEWSQEDRNTFADELIKVAEGVRSGRVVELYCACEDNERAYEIAGLRPKFHLTLTTRLFHRLPVIGKLQLLMQAQEIIGEQIADEMLAETKEDN